MKVGDLVQYRYRNQDIGIIIETMPIAVTNAGTVLDEPSVKFKVMWLDTPSLTDWMRPTGLELINASR